MRRYRGWLIIVSMSFLTAWGCGTSNESEQAATSQGGNQTQNAVKNGTAKPAETVKADTPEATVTIFLEAARTGDDQKVTSMMSSLARQKIASLNGSFAPPASDRAKFTIGKVEYVGDDGARVASTWSDVGEDDQMTSDKYAWVLRKEPEGWRIVGVAAFIDDSEPLTLNFEDPAETKRKLQEIRQQMDQVDSAAEENLQAEQQEEKDTSIRR